MKYYFCKNYEIMSKKKLKTIKCIQFIFVSVYKILFKMYLNI